MRQLIIALILGLGAISACKCGETPLGTIRDAASNQDGGGARDGSGGGGGDGPALNDGALGGTDGALLGDGASQQNDGSSGGRDGTPGEDLGPMDTGPGSACTPLGDPCTRAGTNCCSGTCSASGLCENTTHCKMPGDVCTLATECCTVSCTNGHCGSNLCLADGQGCTTGAQCCSTICGANQLCQAVPAGPGNDTCKTLGETCTTGASCCSTNCQGGVCVRAAACQANGDICLSNADCCGHVCSSTTATPGRCQFVTGGGGGGCLQDGNPCPNGGSNCCSRICVDLGTGAPVCQLAGGCRLTGDWCTSDQDCCGGGSNPNGTVTCRGAPNGRCDNGMACNGTGNICGANVLPDGGSINASQNCCDGRQAVCKVDSSGIPRCFGGCPGGHCGATCPNGYDPTNPACCIASGSACQFQDQCCNREPCVPGADAGLVCANPVSCLVVGEPCTPGVPPGPNGCCAGSECLAALPTGYACQIPAPPPAQADAAAPSPDGSVSGNDGSAGNPDSTAGTPDSGTGNPDAAPPCLTNGQACSSGSMCCSGICTNMMCEPPAACQPQGASCTANGDCCSGLSCAIPGGSTTGTCQPGATCGAQGQSCSLTSACCSGLSCIESGTVNQCTGATACTCILVL